MRPWTNNPLCLCLNIIIVYGGKYDEPLLEGIWALLQRTSVVMESGQRHEIRKFSKLLENYHMKIFETLLAFTLICVLITMIW